MVMHVFVHPHPHLRIEQMRHCPQVGRDVTETSPPLRAPRPARGILCAPPPDGRIDAARILPPPQLAPFIHHFWSVRWALRTPFVADALAHPTAIIMLEEEQAPGDEASVRRAQLLGVRTGRNTKPRAGEGQAFGITFRAAMFLPPRGALMTSLTDRVVPLASVFGPAVDGWARAVLAEPELDAKIALASAFLVARLPPLRPRAERLRDLVERIGADREIVRVEDASAIFGGDVRALQRGFRRYVGVSPKQVIQRFRLLEAAEQLRGRSPPALADLAAALGYADQSHFAREFKLVVGKTPRSFARAWSVGRSAP
jgi:AraC-like DNA-binding protein